MFSSLILALAVGQKKVVDINPVPGSSQFFQTNVAAVVAATSRGDFADAKVKLALLPRHKVTIGWDDSLVPKGKKQLFLDQVQRAIETWPRFLNAFEIKLDNHNPGIKVSFTEQLPVSEEWGLPRGLAVFQSPDPHDSLVEGVISLKRYKPLIEINALNVYGELNYLIGTYLGLEPAPRPGMVMWRSDLLNPGFSDVNGAEARIVRQNLELVDLLIEAVAKKTKLQLNNVSARINPTVIDFGSISQGDPLQKTIEVTNNGDGKMSFSAVPDCSCFTLGFSGAVAPNDTSPLRVLINTRDFPGPFHKSIVVYTNDPTMPSRRIDFRGFIRPAYRMLMQDGQAVLEVGESGTMATMYLLIDPKHPFKITAVQLAGARAQGSFEPWEGVLADPEMEEGAVSRKGYKVQFLISPEALEGRVMVTATAKTDSKTQPFAVGNFFLQRGIATNPSTFFFGEIHGPTEASIVLIPAKRAFKVLKATSDNPHFKTRIEKMPEGEWRVTLEYLGGIPGGQFQGAVKIETDSPTQKVIELPYLGTLS